MSVSCGQGSEGRSAVGKAATVEWGSAAGGTAVLDYITVGGAVGVNYGAVGGSSRSQLAAVMVLDWSGVDPGSNPLHLASKLFDSKSSLELQYIYILKIERLGIGMVL